MMVDQQAVTRTAQDEPKIDRLDVAQEHLQYALEGAELGTWNYDLVSGQIIWSNRCKHLFGLSIQTEVNYDVFLDAVYFEDRERVHVATQNAIANDDRYDIEMRILCPDGITRWIHMKGRTYYSRTGLPIRMAGIAQDITQRKQTEAELYLSDVRLRLATRAVLGLVYDWDVQTNLVFRSEGLYELVGIHADDAATTREWWAERIHPEDLLRLQAALPDILAQGDRYSYEYRVYHQDGRWIDVWDRGYLIRDSAGNLIRVVGFTADISDRKQAEQERERLLEREQLARQQAEAANRIKDEFLAVLSHELRSPLNPILGWTKLLQTRPMDQQQTKRALAIIERNAKLQTQLIEDLLDVSRILQGKMSLTVQPVKLLTVVQAAIETVRLAAEAKTIQMHLHLPPQSDCLYVSGDAARLQQVVWNLLSNAVKFTPNGGQIEIKLSRVMHRGRLEHVSWNGAEIKSQSGLQQGDNVQIQVSDTGKGISPDFLPHVFDYFRQADASTTRAFGGLGIGLAIVRHLVELHGGTVWADSPGDGLGATFTVKLPLLLQADQTLQADSEIQVDTQSPLSGLRILVVDDEADMRDLLLTLLEYSGATVKTCASAQSALEATGLFQPDVLISDIGMPDMDGYMLLQQVQALHPQSNLPAIALTAYAGEIDQQRAIAAGFQKHIAKPVDPTELVELIVALI